MSQINGERLIAEKAFAVDSTGDAAAVTPRLRGA